MSGASARSSRSRRWWRCLRRWRDPRSTTTLPSASRTTCTSAFPANIATHSSPRITCTGIYHPRLRTAASDCAIQERRRHRGNACWLARGCRCGGNAPVPAKFGIRPAAASRERGAAALPCTTRQASVGRRIASCRYSLSSVGRSVRSADIAINLD